MAVPTVKLEALYFERTRLPKERLDWFDAVEHESPEGRALIENLRKLHQQVAKELPLDECVLAFPVEDIAGETWTCVSACTAVRDQGPRPFVRMQTVAVRCSQLEAAGIDAVSLCYAAKWSWLHEKRPAWFELEIDPKQPEPVRFPFCKPLVGALLGEPPLAPESWPKGLGFKELMAGIKAALLQVSSGQRARACFAVRAPARLTTSLKLSFVFLEPERPKDRSRASQSRAAAEFIGRLHDLATAFYVNDSLVEPWRQRLWDQCQNVRSYVEEGLRPGCRDRKRAVRNAEAAMAQLGREAMAAKAPSELLQRIRAYENQIEYYIQLGVGEGQPSSREVTSGWKFENLSEYAIYAGGACCLVFFAVAFVLPSTVPGFSRRLPKLFTARGGGPAVAASGRSDSPSFRSEPVNRRNLRNAARLEFQPSEELYFSPTEIETESGVRSLVIANIGKSRAEVSLRCPDPFFLRSERKFNVQPRSKVIVKVLFAPIEQGRQEAELVVASNDPRRSELRLRLRGEGLPWSGK